MAQEVKTMVEGGKATTGPPLGPALGPLGLNLGQIVKEINEKTKDFAGMQVPITLVVTDAATCSSLIETVPTGTWKVLLSLLLTLTVFLSEVIIGAEEKETKEEAKSEEPKEEDVGEGFGALFG